MSMSIGNPQERPRESANNIIIVLKITYTQTNGVGYFVRRKYIIITTTTTTSYLHALHETRDVFIEHKNS